MLEEKVELLERRLEEFRAFLLNQSDYIRDERLDLDLSDTIYYLEDLATGSLDYASGPSTVDVVDVTGEGRLVSVGLLCTTAMSGGTTAALSIDIQIDGETASTYSFLSSATAVDATKVFHVGGTNAMTAQGDSALIPVNLSYSESLTVTMDKTGLATNGAYLCVVQRATAST